MNEENLSKLRRAAYKEDASRTSFTPLEVFVPESVEEVRDKVLFNKNITIRGGGSGLAGTGGEVVVDLSKLNKVLAFDLDKKEIFVEAGMVLSDLNDFLEKYDLEIPILPLSSKICTIGGMIATNAAGFRFNYGRTGNLVSSLELINGRGELLKLGKADLADVIGEEGITGIIVRARLELNKKPLRTASLFEASSLPEIIELAKKLRLARNISMIFFMDKLTSSFLGLEDKYHIIAEFESARGRETGENYEKLLSLINESYSSLAKLGYIYLEDPKIFIDKLGELAEFLEKLQIPFFADLGAGIIHPCFNENQKALIPKILDYVRKLHGRVTGKFGYGVKKKNYLDNIEKKIITRLKLRYDPGFKFNPGVLVDKSEEQGQFVQEKQKEHEQIEEKENIEQEKSKAEQNKAEQEIEKEKINVEQDEEAGKINLNK